MALLPPKLDQGEKAFLFLEKLVEISGKSAYQSIKRSSFFMSLRGFGLILVGILFVLISGTPSPRDLIYSSLLPLYGIYFILYSFRLSPYLDLFSQERTLNELRHQLCLHENPSPPA